MDIDQAAMNCHIAAHLKHTKREILKVTWNVTLCRLHCFLRVSDLNVSCDRRGNYMLICAKK